MPRASGAIPKVSTELAPLVSFSEFLFITQILKKKWKTDKKTDVKLGPVLVSKELVPDASKLQMRGLKNGKVLQNCGLE